MAEQTTCKPLERPLESWTVDELRERLVALAKWVRVRDHQPHCWGREDPAQCKCGLTPLLEGLPK